MEIVAVEAYSVKIYTDLNSIIIYPLSYYKRVLKSLFPIIFYFSIIKANFLI